MSRFAASLCFAACLLGALLAGAEGYWFLCGLFVLLALWSICEFMAARRNRDSLDDLPPAETSFLNAVLMHGRMLLQRGKTIYLNTRGRLL